MTRTDARKPLQLGLRANLPQFVLLVAVNALVGGMVGQERTVLPLLAFGDTYTAIIAVAVITAASGLDVTLRMAESHPREARAKRPEATTSTP